MRSTQLGTRHSQILGKNQVISWGCLALLSASCSPAFATGPNSFQNCAQWLNNQVDFQVVGGQPGATAPLRMTDNGEFNITNRELLDCLDCGAHPANQSRIVFRENAEVRTLMTAPDSTVTGPTDYKDVVSLERNAQGQVTRVTVDILTGGRGGSIGDRLYTYYRQRNEYNFSYDAQGCFPANATSRSYVGNNTGIVEELFDTQKCIDFDRLYTQLLFTAAKNRDGSERMYRGTQIVIREPGLPPAERLRSPLVQILLAMSPQASPEWRQTTSRLETTTSANPRIEEAWRTRLSTATTRCQGITGFRDNDPRNLRWFVEARRTIPAAGAVAPTHGATGAVSH